MCQVKKNKMTKHKQPDWAILYVCQLYVGMHIQGPCYFNKLIKFHDISEFSMTLCFSLLKLNSVTELSVFFQYFISLPFYSQKAYCFSMTFT